MDYDQLETFLEVARLSSFSRAAEKRFRTQPAISAQIRVLEEEVGAKLLDRSGGKVSLTVPGKVFQKFAEEALASRRQILTSLAEMERGWDAMRLRLDQTAFNAAELAELGGPSQRRGATRPPRSRSRTFARRRRSSIPTPRRRAGS